MRMASLPSHYKMIAAPRRQRAKLFGILWVAKAKMRGVVWLR